MLFWRDFLQTCVIPQRSWLAGVIEGGWSGEKKQRDAIAIDHPACWLNSQGRWWQLTGDTSNGGQLVGEGWAMAATRRVGRETRLTKHTFTEHRACAVRPSQFLLILTLLISAFLLFWHGVETFLIYAMFWRLIIPECRQVLLAIRTKVVLTRWQGSQASSAIFWIWCTLQFYTCIWFCISISIYMAIRIRGIFNERQGGCTCAAILVFNCIWGWIWYYLISVFVLIFTLPIRRQVALAVDGKEGRGCPSFPG